MIRAAIATFFTLAFAAPALADEVTYVIPAVNVSCAGSAKGAELVVQDAVPVRSVEADPTSHTVTAIFDDEAVTIAAVVDSLAAAGYAPGEPSLIER